MTGHVLLHENDPERCGTGKWSPSSSDAREAAQLSHSGLATGVVVIVDDQQESRTGSLTRAENLV